MSESNQKRDSYSLFQQVSEQLFPPSKQDSNIRVLHARSLFQGKSKINKADLIQFISKINKEAKENEILEMINPLIDQDSVSLEELLQYFSINSTEDNLTSHQEKNKISNDQIKGSTKINGIDSKKKEDQNDIILVDKDEDHKMEIEEEQSNQVKEAITYEQNLESLMNKLNGLKDQHLSGTINIQEVRENKSQQKILFKDLLVFMLSLNVELNEEETNIFRSLISDQEDKSSIKNNPNNKQNEDINDCYVYVRDFMDTMQIKDEEKDNQKQSNNTPNSKKPQQNQKIMIQQNNNIYQQQQMIVNNNINNNLNSELNKRRQQQSEYNDIINYFNNFNQLANTNGFNYNQNMHSQQIQQIQQNMQQQQVFPNYFAQQQFPQQIPQQNQQIVLNQIKKQQEQQMIQNENKKKMEELKKLEEQKKIQDQKKKEIEEQKQILHKIQQDKLNKTKENNKQQQEKQVIPLADLDPPEPPSIIPLLKKQSSDFWMSESVRKKDFFQIPESPILGLREFIEKFKDCHQKNKEFIDSQFPPSENSINDNQHHYQYAQWRKLGWYRPYSIFRGQEYNLFNKLEIMNKSRININYLTSPQNIRQGCLGDCYFLSSLSCLAAEPHRIIDLFVTRTVNPYGIYCLRICYDGQWQAVYIDDHIPCYQYNLQPAFTKLDDNEIWVVLLEKAWAKLYKSYSRIEAGHCSEALRDLTGAPTLNLTTFEEVQHNEYTIQQVNETLLPIMKSALQEENRFLVTAASDEIDLTKSQIDRIGLVSSHAYSVLECIEIQHPNLGQVTLIMLRNPWGSKEWKGDWSSESPLWTENLRVQLRVKKQDKGRFYMSLKDFQKYFNTITICYYHDFFYYESLKLNNKGKSAGKSKAKYVRIIVKEKGKYYISIIQKNKRNFKSNSYLPNQQEKYSYSGGRLIVMQIADSQQNQTIQFVDAIQKYKSREIFLECELNQGVYLVQSKLFWEDSYCQQQCNSEYVLSVYGVQQTQLEEVYKLEVSKSILEESIKQVARKSNLQMKYDNVMSSFQVDFKKGFGYYYAQNISDKKYAQVNLTFSSYKGIKAIKPQTLPKIEEVIPPNSELIVILYINSKGFQSSYKEFIRFIN